MQPQCTTVTLVVKNGIRAAYDFGTKMPACQVASEKEVIQ